MKSLSGRLAAAVAMVVMTTVAAEARAGAPDHNPWDDWWKPVLVTSAVVNLQSETVTLHGQNFGKQTPVVFCETEKMRVLRASETEIVVRFSKLIPDGTYLFTVARGNGNRDLERGAFFVTKVYATGGGGVGLPGPQGPAGPAGPPGPAGSAVAGTRGDGLP